MGPISAAKSFASGISAGYDLLTKFISSRPKKGEIRLDFMSTVLRIAAIGLHEINSRIGIEPNKIVLQPYSTTLGLQRRLRGDSREQLGELILPICTSLVVYPPKNPTLQTIYKACRIGLEALIKTYTSHIKNTEMINTDLTFQALNSCVQFINQQMDALGKKDGDIKMGDSAFDISRFLYSEALRNAVQKSNLWTQETLEACEKLLNEANRTQTHGDHEQKSSYLKALLMIADGKDAAFTKIIRGI